MASNKKLAGVAHNIAHHAGSGLSYISPHLTTVLRRAGLETTTINLLHDEPYPEGELEYFEPLSQALKSLQGKAIDILKQNGFCASELASLELDATPPPWDADGYVLHTRVRITSSSGRAFDSGWLG